MILSIAQVLKLRHSPGGLKRFHRKVASGVRFGWKSEITPKMPKMGRRKRAKMMELIRNANANIAREREGENQGEVAGPGEGGGV